MSEKISPASSRSSGISVLTPLPKIASAGGDADLFIRKQAPAHVFANEVFEIEFGIEWNKGKMGESPGRPGDTEIECVAILHHFKTGRRANEDADLWMEPATVCFTLQSSPPRKKQKVKCRILSNLQGSSKRKTHAECYVIRLTPKDEVSSSLRGVQPVTSGPISLVNNKIIITPGEDFDNVWYKDEGGRDKCMTVTASLYDQDNNLYTGERIPLQMTLCYASDPPFRVIKQDILRPLGSLNLGTDPATGQATLRFRIEDVSKNHQGQDFKIEVAPDSKVKGFNDIAPGFTPAVSVRSKRNKRHRTVSSGGKDVRLYSPTRPGSRGFTSDDISRMDAPFAASPDFSHLREAIQGVMQWTEEVVNGLYPLQWHVIGYNQNPDGTPDYNRPYHSMPNPNAQISRVLSMYSDSTREQLQVISSALERMDHKLNDPYQRTSDESFSVAPIPTGMSIQGPPNNSMQGIAPRGQYHGGPPPRGSLSLAPADFHDNTDLNSHLLYPPSHSGEQSMRPTMPPMHLSVNRSRATGRQGMPPPNTMGTHPMHHGHGLSHVAQIHRSPPSPIHTAMPQARLDDVSRESEVAFVLAKHFKAMRTGQRLGFPAYSATREILGFYRESNLKVGVGQFVPISSHPEDFGPLEIMQATEILEGAIESKSEAVHALTDWGNISNMLDHALVYDWSRGELGSGISTNRSSSGDGDD